MGKEKRMWAAKVDERGRITIPKDLLDLLGFKPDDILVFVKEDKGPVFVGRGQFQLEVPFAQKSEEPAGLKKPERRVVSSRKKEYEAQSPKQPTTT
jgi:AbrB family looped-hinge helix DNA binding protein